MPAIEAVLFDYGNTIVQYDRPQWEEVHLVVQANSRDDVSLVPESLAFGQVKFSRESIAEFQIVTNQYDITQGRSTGMQVQAITKAGSNTMSGSAYGYFRDAAKSGG